ncbi:MAG: amidinotransferase, partial [Myxococcota bacterium]
MSDKPTWGVSSMAGPLRRVAMRAPGAIHTADHERWHYAKPIDAQRLDEQYSVFVDAVVAAGSEIVWIPNDPDDDLADSIFTYDP